MDALVFGSRVEEKRNTFSPPKTTMRKKKKEAPKPPSASFLHSSFTNSRKSTTASSFPGYSDGETIPTTSQISNASFSSLPSKTKRRAPLPPINKMAINGKIFEASCKADDFEKGLNMNQNSGMRAIHEQDKIVNDVDAQERATKLEKKNKEKKSKEKRREDQHHNRIERTTWEAHHEKKKTEKGKIDHLNQQTYNQSPSSLVTQLQNCQIDSKHVRSEDKICIDENPYSKSLKSIENRNDTMCISVSKLPAKEKSQEEISKEFQEELLKAKSKLKISGQSEIVCQSQDGIKYSKDNEGSPLPPPPPVLPSTLVSKTRPEKENNCFKPSMNAREELMLAIRNKGGIGGLRPIS